MSRLFDEYYSFSIPRDYIYRIDKYTPATGNREHKHKDIEKGLDNYTINWECIATDSSRRRGSDKLYLVEDSYYVWGSRTGMEKAGNAIHFSGDSPEELRFAVLSAVFEAISERKFGEIKESGAEVDFGNLKVMTPKLFVLKKELTESEIEDYFDDIAELTVDLIDRYHSTSSVEALEELISWYKQQTTEVFREYIDFEPTILSQAISNIEKENGWIVPKNIDSGKSLAVILHEDFKQTEKGFVESVIEITETTNTVRLLYVVDNNETILEEEKYEDVPELEHYIEKFMQFTPSEYNP